MAEIYNNKLCVLLKEIIRYNPKKNIGSDTGFVSEGSFYSMVDRGQIVITRRGSRSTQALVEFDNMRPDIKEKYIEIYGDPRASIRQKSLLEESIEYSEAAYTFFQEHGTQIGKRIKPEKIAEYTLSARILDAVLKLRSKKRQMSIGSGSTRFNIWENLSTMVNELLEFKDVHGNQLYPHKLPSSWSRLKKKALKYEKEGYISLLHQGTGNKSASRVKNAENEAALHKLLSLHNNLNNVQIMDEYNRIAEITGWEPIKSPNTIDKYRKLFNVTTVSYRQGAAALNNGLKKQVHRSAPETAMTYWTLDGWTAELLYQKKQKKTRKDADGIEKNYMVTTYTNRKTMVVVLDPCQKYPVGYAIGDNESPALIRQALRNAIKHTRELFGSRYKPLQMQSDNYQKKTMVPFYEAMTKHYTPAALKNAKSKVVEPYFKHLNVDYCQRLPNWAGFGITSDKDKQPNTEIMNVNHKLLPDEAGVIAQLEEIIRKERASKIDAYMKAWENTPEERRLPFSDEEYLMLMGDTTGYTNRINGNGLFITIQGTKINFDSFDMSLRDHYNEDWLVRYDPDDLSQILVSNAERLKSGKAGKEYGEYRYMMQRDIVVPMALVDQKEEHFEYRSKVSSFNKELEQKVIDKQTETTEALQQLCERIPMLINNTLLDRLMITDSKGQHKDARTEMRELGKESNFNIPAYEPDTDFEFNARDFVASSF